MRIKVSVEQNINTSKLLKPVRNDVFWKFAAVEWHKQYADYVPMGDSGLLYKQVTFAPKTITHTVPYAHYQYEGQVYGPNIPITEGDNVVGYYSTPNRKKRPTGKALRYRRDLHPKASRKWDKAAEPTRKPELVKALQKYLRGKFDG